MDPPVNHAARGLDLPPALEHGSFSLTTSRNRFIADTLALGVQLQVYYDECDRDDLWQSLHVQYPRTIFVTEGFVHHRPQLGGYKNKSSMSGES